MKKKLLYFFSAAVCLAAFTAFTNVNLSAKANLTDQLIGEWRNVYVKIVIHHKDSADAIMEADSTNWEERLQMKPIQTHFAKNGTYYSEYHNLKDSLVR